MVQFKEEMFESQGPCEEIVERQKDFLVEMVQETTKTGKEQIVNFVKVDGNIGHTDMREGTEESITNEVSSKSMMDTFSLARELSEESGHVNIHERKRYQVHTHPQGHVGMSLADMKSFADDIVSGGDYPDAELVVVKSDMAMEIGGVYLPDGIDGVDVAEIQSGLSRVNAHNVPMAPSEEQEEMLESFRRAGVEFCNVEFSPISIQRKGG